MNQEKTMNQEKEFKVFSFVACIIGIAFGSSLPFQWKFFIKDFDLKVSHGLSKVFSAFVGIILLEICFYIIGFYKMLILANRLDPHKDCARILMVVCVTSFSLSCIDIFTTVNLLSYGALLIFMLLLSVVHPECAGQIFAIIKSCLSGLSKVVQKKPIDAVTTPKAYLSNAIHEKVIE